MQRQTFSVRDHGEILTFSWESLYAYVGPAQIIASALMFRLFERSFAELSHDAPPDRGDMAFLSGFPGAGIAECVELVTRIRTRRPDRYIVAADRGPEDAPRHPLGKMYFEVQAGNLRRGYWPHTNLFDQVFFHNVKQYQDGSGTAEEQKKYLAFKKALAARILETPREELFSSQDAAPAGLSP